MISRDAYTKAAWDIQVLVDDILDGDPRTATPSLAQMRQNVEDLEEAKNTAILGSFATVPVPLAFVFTQGLAYATLGVDEYEAREVLRITNK